MSDFMKQCVDSYLALAEKDPKSLKSAATPFLDEQEDEVGTGHLQSIACKVLMKILYGARMARPDLLKAVSYLASRVTKWSTACDRSLHRLICYIHQTVGEKQCGWIGDSPSKLYLNLYADADFAGCKVTMRSTSGVFMTLAGPNSCMPLAAASRKQTCVSHSTPEAEIVALDAAMRSTGIPSLEIWDLVFGRPTQLNLLEDNTTCIQIIKTGKSPTLRHLGRTHGVSIKWLHEVFRKHKSNIKLGYIDTKLQAADIFTKPFSNKILWQHALSLIGFHNPTAKEEESKIELKNHTKQSGK